MNRRLLVSVLLGFLVVCWKLIRECCSQCDSETHTLRDAEEERQELRSRIGEPQIGVRRSSAFFLQEEKTTQHSVCVLSEDQR